MSQTITSPVITFNSGKVQVIILPEEPNYPCLDCRTMDCEATQDYCEHTKYREAVAYARAHPIPVDKRDVKRILWEIYEIVQPKDIGRKDWQPQDLTEYKLEVELKIERDCERQKHEGLSKCDECYFKGSAIKQCKQVACLYRR